MSQETEVKVRIEPSDILALVERLFALGFELEAERTWEENVLFDLPDDQLSRRGCALRLRRFGDQCTLTYKGPRIEDPYLKVRQEIECRVSDFDALKRILEALGFKPAFRYEKYRRRLRLGEGSRTAVVCIDETPVGCFVEIEGGPEEIEKYAGKLGWSRAQFLTVNYVDLYRDKGYGEV